MHLVYIKIEDESVYRIVDDIGLWILLNNDSIDYMQTISSTNDEETITRLMIEKDIRRLDIAI